MSLGDRHARSTDVNIVGVRGACVSEGQIGS